MEMEKRRQNKQRPCTHIPEIQTELNEIVSPMEH